MSCRFLWGGICLGLFTAVGCAPAHQQHVIINQLPDPVFYSPAFAGIGIDFPVPDAPKSVVRVRPARHQGQLSDPNGWIPAGGIGGRWRYIVIHHTASDIGSLADIHKWHLDNGWENGCGYDFIIGNGTHSGDGQIEVGPRWRKQIVGAHTRLSEKLAARKGIDSNHYNEHGIGIVLVGNFDHDRPSPAQMASLDKLVRFLMREANIPSDRVIGHGDVDQTDCPGRYLSIPRLRARLKNTF